jgi:hypothetical protein
MVISIHSQTQSTLNAKYEAQITSIDAGTALHVQPIPQNAIFQADFK